MDLGIPMLMELSSVEEAAELAHRLGFSFVELNMNLPSATLEQLQKTDLQKLMDAYSIYFTIHADENLFFCDFSERVADAHLKNMLDTLALCRKYKLPLVNFHMSKGVYFTLPEEKVYLFEKYNSFYQSRLIAFRDACEKAAGNQVMLCIENTGLDLPFVHQGVDLLLQSPAFGLTWDVGHDFSSGNRDTPFLLPRSSRIAHMHFHDGMGRECHLPLGSGQMPLNTYLKQANPQRLVLEVKTVDGIIQSLPWLKNNRI